MSFLTLLFVANGKVDLIKVMDGAKTFTGKRVDVNIAS